MNESSISSILKRIDTKMPKSTQECPQKNPTTGSQMITVTMATATG